MKKIIFGVAGFLSLWGFAFFAQAQENAAGEDNNAEVSDIVLIADVNIHEAQIASREENKFKLLFELSNGKGIQSNIGYSVALIQDEENKGQILVDEKNYKKKHTIKRRSNYKG